MIEKLAGAFTLSLIAQAAPSAGLPDVTAFGSSAAAFGLLIWLLVQERARADRQRQEFLAEIREHRVVVSRLSEVVAKLERD